MIFHESVALSHRNIVFCRRDESWSSNGLKLSYGHHGSEFVPLGLELKY